MERIKRFFWDDTASAEATSTVLLIAATSIFFAGGLVIWWPNIKTFLTGAGDTIGGLTTPASTGIGALGS
jgi:hypothetical protein